MKTMKKKKLAVIGIVGIAGMLYSATPASAQTFYQCMPINCPAGSYLENGECKQCPYGTYSLGNNATSCTKCAKKVYYKGPGGCNDRSDLWTRMELSVGGGGCYCGKDGHLTTSTNICGTEVIKASGKYGLSSYYQSVILLSCDRKTGETYFFNAYGKNGYDGFTYYGKDEGGGCAIKPCQDDPIHCAYTQYDDGSVFIIKR